MVILRAGRTSIALSLKYLVGLPGHAEFPPKATGAVGRVKIPSLERKEAPLPGYPPGLAGPVCLIAGGRVIAVLPTVPPLPGPPPRRGEGIVEGCNTRPGRELWLDALFVL